MPETQNKRADLHCHSLASTRSSELGQREWQRAEREVTPELIYTQARKRGMDFVTVTDHDTFTDVNLIPHRKQQDVFTGEELTCRFPEDRRKVHLLVWGITRADHQNLRAIAMNVYQVAQYLADHQIAHAVSHTINRKTSGLDLWHIERLMLLFKGFECFNGADDVFDFGQVELMIDQLTPEEIEKLFMKHGLEPFSPEPHIKARTAGSNEYTLENLGKIWTEFPPGTQTVEDVLNHLRTGNCRPACHSFKVKTYTPAAGGDPLGQSWVGFPTPSPMTYDK
jgi:hypothetical protein